MVDRKKYLEIVAELKEKNIQLVAVSKTKPVESIRELFELGHRDFGENYVQEMAEKQQLLPSDIRWHFIGHLQTNKVKYIAGFVHLIHGIDSFKLLKEVHKQALKNNRVIDVLLQIHIANEETKFGLDEEELHEILHSNFDEPTSPASRLHELKNIRVIGLMGMASFTADENQIRKEFKYLRSLFDKYKNLTVSGNDLPTTNHAYRQAGYQPSTLSMGMSSDYKIAIEEGSSMVRIGSLLFGSRS